MSIYPITAPGDAAADPDGPCLMAIDQGTTSSRAILFSAGGTPLVTAQKEITQYYPEDGWVEQNPEEIWSKTLLCCREVMASPAGRRVVAAGITNQRETVILWDRASGEPLYNAIVWKDRRTANHCRALREAGHEPWISERTGLLLDPYFSATKLTWLLDQIEGARERAERGELAFGTVDSFLLWRLSEGEVHATDATNASRTLLFDIHRQCWDPELLALFRIPEAILPEVRDSAASFGRCRLLQHPLPITAMAGDQQAATVGQACIRPGMSKCTYGTGTFMMLNTGSEAITSRSRLLTTVAYRLNEEVTYALEGSVFVAGAAVKWLRDRLSLIDDAGETEILAARLESNGGVYLVPAFNGLGAPYWDPEARAALFGLRLDSGPAEIARATLESVAYQTHDLWVAMAQDGAAELQALRVDGGMVANDWLLQCLADLLNIPVERPRVIETTALGAAYLAGLQAGVYRSLEEIAAGWERERRFEPIMPSEQRDQLLSGWVRAVEQARGFKIS